MLNYGAAAQVLFDYETDNLANAAMSIEDKVLADVDASAYQHSVTGSEEGIEVAFASLLLESNTNIRVYYRLTGEKSIEEYTFLVNGEEVTPVEKNGMYYVELSGIAAHKLDQMNTFTVGGLSVEYAALSYVNQVVLQHEESVMTDLVKALFAYAMATEAFVG